MADGNVLAVHEWGLDVISSARVRKKPDRVERAPNPSAVR